ncbi:MAG: MBL fold metallo-hydrolase [Candidatus Krumholzibacteriota bacterium]|nr:MBL fold metallo-hydrolase [Candidatus Krumholzibacteriota bacterium]
MSKETPKIITNVVGILATNSYVLYCPVTKEAVIIDPGGEAQKIKESIDENSLNPTGVILTHGHSDHMASAADILKNYNIGLAIHSDDIDTMKKSIEEAPLWGLGEIEEPAVERLLKEGDKIKVGSITGSVLSTPGHTKGGISLKFDGFVLAGDTLFAGSIGRTDFFGGDRETLLNSIRLKLLELPDDTVVYCGHGPSTTIGDEKRRNPFINGML